MYRIGLIMAVAFLFACKDKKAEKKASEPKVKKEQQQQSGPTTPLPYELTDTALLQNKDTATIRGMAFSEWLSDSLRNKIFGKGTKVKLVPLAKIETAKSGKKTGFFYIVKGEAGHRKAALLFSLDREEHFNAVLPFLVPDDDASTRQVSTIDKAYSISRSVIRKQSDDVMAEGKDVYAYNNDSHQFNLIMTDILDDKNLELINPIDTFPKMHKLAGDYMRDKKNVVSIRDGRKSNMLTVFVHIDNNKDDCTGELKGDAEIIAPNKLLYRQAGDPCVLQFTFTSSAVTLKEQEGCGAHRGLQCAFDGTFSRKKEPKSKISKKTKKIINK